MTLTVTGRVRSGWFVLTLPAVFPVAAVGQSSQLTLRGFGDVRFMETSEPGVPSAFGIGQYDTYVSGALSERVDMASEIVVEHDQVWVVDLERFWIRYTVSPALRVSAGKFHTPLGYWNRAFHHGALLYPSVDRPLLFAFEDEGGPLPIHTTGVLVDGRQRGGARWGYAVMIGNGIGGDPVSDRNEAKSVTARVTVHPDESVAIGAAWYHDRIPAGTIRTDGNSRTVGPVTQNLSLVDIEVRGGPIEVVTEGMVGWNRSFGRTSVNNGGYAMASANLGSRWTPFVRYDRIDFATGDPYYVGPDVNEYTAGVRHHVAVLAAIKLEVRLRRVGGRTVRTLASQFAVAW